ncbi:hypothetical protein PG995_007731 [Apiospora arundinis]
MIETKPLALCGGSTFVKSDKAQWKVGGEAANIKHCTELMDYCEKNRGKALYNAVKSKDNCAIAFKVKNGDSQGAAGLAMSSGDVSDAIHNSIAKFGEDGKVHAHGETFCKGSGGDGRWGERPVEWKIYNAYA